MMILLTNNMGKKVKRNYLKYLVFLVILIILIGGYIYWAINRSSPSIKPNYSYRYNKISTPTGTLLWPTYGQSAVAVDNVTTGSSGTLKPAPMASTAKLITALCVLNKYPLKIGEQGPSIDISADDVALNAKYVGESGSHTNVVLGEKLNEYQMLEAMMLPSANNIADSLAIWAFGSLDAYKTYATNYLASHQITNTTIGADASGFDPSTTSTATDLIKIGQLSMADPSLSDIVSKPYVDGIPVVGRITNINSLLGINNVVGIKTGNTDQAGGVFVSGSKIKLNNQEVIIYTSIMGAPNLGIVLKDSLSLIRSAQTNFTPSKDDIFSKGKIVGYYTVPWSKKTIYAISPRDIGVSAWMGSIVDRGVSLDTINSNTKAGDNVGHILTTSLIPKYSVTNNLTLNEAPGTPSNLWKILHPFSTLE